MVFEYAFGTEENVLFLRKRCFFFFNLRVQILLAVVEAILRRYIFKPDTFDKLLPQPKWWQPFAILERKINFYIYIFTISFHHPNIRVMFNNTTFYGDFLCLFQEKNLAIKIHKHQIYLQNEKKKTIEPKSTLVGFFPPSDN